MKKTRFSQIKKIKKIFVKKQILTEKKIQKVFIKRKYSNR